MVPSLDTPRLTLVPGTAALLRSELEGHAAFAALLAAEVPPSWPPGEYDRDAQEFFLAQLESGGDAAVGWFGWYGAPWSDVHRWSHGTPFHDSAFYSGGLPRWRLVQVHH